MHSIAQAGAEFLNFKNLGLSPIALDLGIIQIRWYALSYAAMILLGWWYLKKLLARPGAPMGPQHADDLIVPMTLGIILGGRLGYSLFYMPELWRDPFRILRLWEGGMSVHGGFAGVMVALFIFTWQRQLNLLRVCDYIACASPFGLFLVRIANFVNGELWGRPTGVPWAIIFPQSGTLEPRHPSQLYEAVLEGLVIGIVLWLMFWRTNARFHSGRLFGTGLLLYGLFRFGVEFLRQPDNGLEHLGWGLTMGQTLSVPLIIAGGFFILRSFTGGNRLLPLLSDSKQ